MSPQHGTFYLPNSTISFLNAKHSFALRTEMLNIFVIITTAKVASPAPTSNKTAETGVQHTCVRVFKAGSSYDFLTAIGTESFLRSISKMSLIYHYYISSNRAGGRC